MSKSNTGTFQLEELEKDNSCFLQWTSNRLVEFTEKEKLGTPQLSSQRILNSPHIESYLESLQAALDLKIADLNAAAQINESTFTSGLSRINDECQILGNEVGSCQSQLQTLLSRLKVIGTDQLPSISNLSEVDLLKRRLTACRQILGEVHQWDIRARELEILLKSLQNNDAQPPVVSKSSADDETRSLGHVVGITPGLRGGSLGQAVSHLSAMKEAAKALKGWPQFAAKSNWIHSYETRLIQACSSRLRQFLEAKSSEDFIQCGQIFNRLGFKKEFINAVVEAFSSILANNFENQWSSTWYIHQRMSVIDQITISDEAHKELENKHNSLLNEDAAVVEYYKEASELMNTTYQLLRGCHSLSAMFESPESLTDLVLQFLRSLFSVPITDLNEFFQAAAHSTDIHLCERALSVISILEMSVNIICAVELVGEVDELTNTITKENALSKKTYTSNSSFWNNFCEKASDIILPVSLVPSGIAPFKYFLEKLTKQGLPLKSISTPLETISEIEAHTVCMFKSITACFNVNAGRAAEFVFSLPPYDFSERTTFPIVSAMLAPEIIGILDYYLSDYWASWTSLLLLFENTTKLKSEKKKAYEINPPSKLPSESLINFSAPLIVNGSILGPCCQLPRLISSTCFSELSKITVALWTLASFVWDKESRFNTACRCFSLRPQAKNNEFAELLETSRKKRIKNDVFNIPILSTILPKTFSALYKLFYDSQKVIIFCTLFPIRPSFQGYSLLNCWQSTLPIIPDIAPTGTVTTIGEYLLAVVPYFDDAIVTAPEHWLQSMPTLYASELDGIGPPSESHDVGNSNVGNDVAQSSSPLDAVLEETTQLFCEAVFNIKEFNLFGLNQLYADAMYLQRAFSVLGEQPLNIQTLTRYIQQWLLNNREFKLLPGDAIFHDFQFLINKPKHET